MLPDRTAGEWTSPPRSEPVESGFAEARAWMADIEQIGRTFIGRRPIVSVLAAVGMGYLAARLTSRMLK
jgi:hypothetical protein